MDFNNYLNHLESGQNDEIYTQLETVYAENSALIQSFQAIDKQFVAWLNQTTFNAKVISAILPKLETVFPALANLKFSLEEAEEEIAPQLRPKLEQLQKRIVSNMTYQETALYQQRLEKLLEQNEALIQSNPIASVDVKQTISPLEPKMVFIRGGTFMMRERFGRTITQMQVTISDFYMSKYPITQAEWKVIMGNNPSNFQGDNLPVEQVNWYEVQQYISLLNQKTGKRYRLPTEAEWEYAAIGGKLYPEPFLYAGSDDRDEVAWDEINSGDRTHPVGLKKSNGYGLHDMSGNVLEWCSDWDGDYYNGFVTNPTGAVTGTHRVMRGGSWGRNARNCRINYRHSELPLHADDDIGFRLVSPTI